MRRPHVRTTLLILAAFTGLVAAPGGLISCDAETAGESARFTTGFGGATLSGDPVTSFATDAGWQVDLDVALAAVGPVYLYEGEAMAGLGRRLGGLGAARACPAHAQYDDGTVLGEVLEQYMTDLLADDPTPTGEIDGTRGTCQSFEVHLHPPGEITAGSPGEDFDPLQGFSVWLQGTATSGDEVVPFEAGLTIPDEGTQRIVESIPADVEIVDADEQPGMVVVLALLDRWFAEVDFATLVELGDGDRYRFTEGIQATNALIFGIRSRYAYELAWEEE